MLQAMTIRGFEMKNIILIMFLGFCVMTARSASSVDRNTDYVLIEYIAHASFIVISPDDYAVLIDPYESRWWLGYDFPVRPLKVDAVLSSHPHPDHDGGLSSGHTLPWPYATPVLAKPGSYVFGDIGVTAIEGRHAEPYGKEFGQTNTVWVLEIAGLRIAHIGDNGPITDAIAEEIGIVDILMLPIDSEYHVLSHDQIEDWRRHLEPDIVIPMHYRHPDLETDPDSPSDLGNINGWLKTQRGVRQLTTHRFKISSEELPMDAEVMVFKHSVPVQSP